MTKESAVSTTPIIGVIGSGSWGTALVYHLAQRFSVLWYVRNPENAEMIRRGGRNPSYLRAVELPLKNIRIYSELRPILRKATGVILVIPSRFLRPILDVIASTHTKANWIASAVKGMVMHSPHPLLVSEYLIEQCQWPANRFFVISGPSHAEELVERKTTFLTVAGSSIEAYQSTFESVLATSYLKLLYSTDVIGIQYAGIIKNVYAIMAGIIDGMGMGDNFKAVMMTAALREMQMLAQHMANHTPPIFQPAYAGDLLVTGYSRHSRNRALGLMVGQGMRPRMALHELQMIPEGYFAVEALHQRLGDHLHRFPILHSTYHILYEGYSPQLEIKLLAEQIHRLFHTSTLHSQ